MHYKFNHQETTPEFGGCFFFVSVKATKLPKPSKTLLYTETLLIFLLVIKLNDVQKTGEYYGKYD